MDILSGLFRHVIPRRGGFTQGAFKHPVALLGHLVDFLNGLTATSLSSLASHWRLSVQASNTVGIAVQFNGTSTVYSPSQYKLVEKN